MEERLEEQRAEQAGEQDIIMLVDDDGVERPFFVIATLKLDDVDYALLTDDKKIEESAGVMVFRIVDESGELTFEGVDDDEEIDAVLLAAEELFYGEGDEE